MKFMLIAYVTLPSAAVGAVESIPASIYQDVEGAALADSPCRKRSASCFASVEILKNGLRADNISPAIDGRLKQLGELARKSECTKAGFWTILVKIDLASCSSDMSVPSWVFSLSKSTDDAVYLEGCAPLGCVPARQARWGWGQIQHIFGNDGDKETLEAWDCEVPPPSRSCLKIRYWGFDPESEVSERASAQEEKTPCCMGGACEPGEKHEWHWFLQQSISLVWVENAGESPLLPAVLRYSEKPEVWSCPPARIVLKLYHLSWMFPLFGIKKTRWSLFSSLLSDILSLNWLGLVSTGWGIPIFGLLDQISIQICNSSDVAKDWDRERSVKFCEGERGLDSAGDLQDFGVSAIVDGSLERQVRFVVNRSTQPLWQLGHLAASMDSAVRAPFLILAHNLYAANWPSRGTDTSEDLLEKAQRIFRWAGTQKYSPAHIKGFVERSFWSKEKTGDGSLLLGHLDDILRSDLRLWGLLFILSVRDALKGGRARRLEKGKLRLGVERKFGLEGQGKLCESCESRWGWVNGTSKSRKRTFKSVAACDSRGRGDATFVFPTVLLDASSSKTSIHGHVLGVSLAEADRHHMELEMMVEFYDLWGIEHELSFPEASLYPDVCGYKHEMDIGTFACVFSDDTVVRASVTPAAGAINTAHPNLGQVIEMNPGPPLILSCAVPDGMHLPLHVQIQSLEHNWQTPLDIHLCELQDEPPVELAICMRSVHDLDPEVPILQKWLTYYFNLGVGKVFVYDIDGSAEGISESFPPGLVERQPRFYSRGNKTWFDRLARQGRWQWDTLRHSSKFGCHVAQLNHCIFKARGRAQYVFMLRALDKLLVSTSMQPLDDLLQDVHDMDENASRSGQALGSVALAAYDYWQPRPCKPTCYQAHQLMAKHNLPTIHDSFVSLFDPGQVVASGPHVACLREGSVAEAFASERFWVAHFLCTFELDEQVQAAEPQTRWRLPFCHEVPDSEHCATLVSDNGIAAFMYESLAA